MQSVLPVTECHVFVMTAIKITIKTHPEKQNPGHYLLYQIELDVPYLKFHEQLANGIIHKCMYALLSLQWFQQPQHSKPAVCLQATAFSSFLFLAWSSRQPVFYHLHAGGEKKARGRGSIYTVCLYSVRACCSGELWCVCLHCLRKEP